LNIVAPQTALLVYFMIVYNNYCGCKNLGNTHGKKKFLKLLTPMTHGKDLIMDLIFSMTEMALLPIQ